MPITLLKEGIFTSIQSLEHRPLQRFGINPRGPMDQFAARIANILVGNDEAASVLEMHFPAPQIRFEEDCLIALTGADMTAVLNGIPVRNWAVHPASAGDILTFERRVLGSCAYVSFGGGIAVDGTRFSTERLEKNARIAFRRSLFKNVRKPSFVSRSILPLYSESPRIQVVPCGEYDLLSSGSIEVFLNSSFQLTSQSNRMGFRLQGDVLQLTKSVELASAAVNFGTIQLLPDGQLVILMADHQTSGGYPRIANVISADLPLLGQLCPGDKVSFAISGIDEAERAAAATEDNLRKLRTGLQFGRYW